MCHHWIEYVNYYDIFPWTFFILNKKIFIVNSIVLLYVFSFLEGLIIMKLILVGKLKKIYRFRTNNHFKYYTLTSILYIISYYYTRKRFIEPNFDTIVPSVDILVKKIRRIWFKKYVLNIPLFCLTIRLFDQTFYPHRQLSHHLEF